jgi:DhnA family fructose-bisphosphate aldolase class Ia
LAVQVVCTKPLAQHLFAGRWASCLLLPVDKGGVEQVASLLIVDIELLHCSLFADGCSIVITAKGYPGKALAEKVEVFH